MTREQIEKLSRYVAFLYREFDGWKDEPYAAGRARYFLDKINTVREICEMLGCADVVWSEARKFYTW